MTKRKHLLKRDSLDKRDYVAAHAPQPVDTFMLFKTYNTPPVVDQGQLGSCTANAGGAGGFHFALMNKPNSTPNPQAPLYNPSRLFLYYNTRLSMGTTGEDSGASIRDTMKAINKYGICQEAKWPYDISKFTEKPPQECYDQALKLKGFVYHRLPDQTTATIVSALKAGHPVIFGMLVFSSFESRVVANTGEVPMPTPKDTLLGGHALAIWGYNAEEKYFVVRNSWGQSWGINGYCHIPEAYITNPRLAFDFWTTSLPQK